MTLTAQDGTTCHVYTRPKKLLINLNSNGHEVNVTVEYKQGASNATWQTLGTYGISGWSGWNEIDISSLSTLGGDTTQTSNNWYFRLTYAVTKVSNSYETARPYIVGIRLFGDTCWTRTSNMGETGHLYSYDAYQNATFPAGIAASEFSGYDAYINYINSYDDSFVEIDCDVECYGYIDCSGNITGDKVYGAVWNDYAEYRNQIENIAPGYCVISHNDGKVSKTTMKLQACDGIVSDTFGFAIGETENCKTPLAVAGRVLAYCEGDRNDYNAGDTVCAGPDGKVCKMTREEIREWPDRIVGIVSEIPTYEVWGAGQIQVNNRIWIKVK